jgi:hypothetical protein
MMIKLYDTLQLEESDKFKEHFSKEIWKIGKNV